MFPFNKAPTGVNELAYTETVDACVIAIPERIRSQVEQLIGTFGKRAFEILVNKADRAGRAKQVLEDSTFTHLAILQPEDLERFYADHN